MFTIHTDFLGGNAILHSITDSTVTFDSDLRDTTEDWFYWALRVDGAAGQTLRFETVRNRIGYYGPAVSTDYENWHWLESEANGSRTSFTYTFGEGEDSVYFAHSMLYRPERLYAFADRRGIKLDTLCRSRKGRGVPCFTLGSGCRTIILTARHHACEATGSYVLEGLIDEWLSHPLPNTTVFCVPCIDMDGVTDGDQGKSRAPYDHNRDYGEASIYPEVAALRAYAAEHPSVMFFDFHSPWHLGSQNDHVFFSRSTMAMESSIDRFAAILAEETVSLPFRYEIGHDVGPNEAWNKESSPSSKNAFARFPGMQISTTLETPYFGLPGGEFTQERGLELGRAFARSIVRFFK